jgi:hypothetical protein
MAYDQKDGYTVLFGGASSNQFGEATNATNYTWKFQNGAWTNITPPHSPPARYLAGMAYDAADGMIVLFGGATLECATPNSCKTSDLNDTWEFSGGIWTKVVPTNSPEAREGAAMTYDTGDGYLLLFGGEGESHGPQPLNDTWEFQAGEWTNISSYPAPAASSNPLTAVDDVQAGDVVVIEGSVNVRLNSTLWSYAGGHWAKLPSVPLLRGDQPALSYDPSTGYVVLFGGLISTGPGQYGTLGDTWILSGGTWRNVTSTFSPPPNYGAPMAPDAQGNPVLYGGMSYLTYGSLNETWTYNGLASANNITFSEVGLPSGAGWSVTLNGVSSPSTSSLITFIEQNGSYPFTVSGPSGYTASPSVGSVSAQGKATAETITFSRVAPGSTYAVTFTENGLPAGTSWSVTLNGTKSASSASTVSFNEPNGTYPFIVGTLTGYLPSPSSGSASVAGAGVDMTIVFSEVPPGAYLVTFTESGLPQGANWSVKLAQSTKSGTAGAISFVEQNGTYPYSVSSVNGYVPSPSSGNVTISGSGRSIGISFSSKSSSGSGAASDFLGLPGDTGYYVVGGVVAVAVGGTGAAFLRRHRRPRKE